ncbi:ribonuclease HIII [Kurthia sp. 3B1D]|uniref:Ribonuclease HIII n=1 Tax=Candidatus Kurthia intestinigallinarum TaxID=1562256 RepID=A0A433RY34_9BACL|nr:ribonuclease HIII [Kurthia sp. 3B1D]RUS58191.1 ribonuclease HIII [Kurthia sp. 3B1D]
MSTIVLKLSAQDQQKVHDYYDAQAVPTNAPGAVFMAKTPYATITSYKSGKVMFQGTEAEQEANRFGEFKAPTTTTSPKGDKLPEKFANMNVLGSDETGTGDYFGPITVAAAYVPQDKMALLKELGVKDSKMLTDAKMRAIAPAIMEAVPYSVLTLHNDKYNKVKAQGWSQGKIKALLHNQALRHVLSKIAPTKPDFILIDQFEERDTYYRHIQEEKDIIRDNVLFSTKAEQLHLSVAAASIIARYAFLSTMDQLSVEIGVELPKGASAKVDQVAANILLSQGEEALQSVTKWHFANTTKASRIAAKNRMI